MDSSETQIVTFEDVPVSESGQNIAALRDQLLEDCPGLQADIRKDDPTTQDFGATLILLGAPAIVALAKGLSNYLSRRPNGTLVLKRDGDVIFEETPRTPPRSRKRLPPK